MDTMGFDVKEKTTNKFMNAQRMYTASRGKWLFFKKCNSNVKAKQFERTMERFHHEYIVLGEALGYDSRGLERALWLWNDKAKEYCKNRWDSEGKKKVANREAKKAKKKNAGNTPGKKIFTKIDAYTGLKVSYGINRVYYGK